MFYNRKTAFLATLSLLLAGCVPAGIVALIVSKSQSKSARTVASKASTLAIKTERLALNLTAVVEQAREKEISIYTRLCDHNNLVKAVQRNADTRRVTLVKVISGRNTKALGEAERGKRGNDKLLVILDCPGTFSAERTVKDWGRAIPLAPSQDKRYLEFVDQARVPIVKNGIVVGSRTPESGELADF